MKHVLAYNGQRRLFYFSVCPFGNDPSTTKPSAGVLDELGKVDHTVKSLYNGLLKGNRATLAKAITLVESVHPKHRKWAQALLTKILLHQKEQQQDALKDPTFRIGNLCVGVGIN